MKTEALKKLGEKFLLLAKAHYEKAALGAVLLVLMLIAVLEFLNVRAEHEALAGDPMASAMSMGNAKAKPMDFSRQIDLLRLAGAPATLDLGKSHYVFNPGLWKQYSNVVTRVRSGKEFGIGALLVTNISPINLTLTAKAGGSEERPNYSLQGSDDLPSPTYKIQRSLSASSTVVKIVDQPGVPTNAVSVALYRVSGDFESKRLSFDVELRYGGTTNRALLLQDRPQTFLRGYSTSLVYKPANKPELQMVYSRRRVGTQIEIDGETYTIRQITAEKVVFSNDTTGRETEIPLSGARL